MAKYQKGDRIFELSSIEMEEVMSHGSLGCPHPECDSQMKLLKYVSKMHGNKSEMYCEQHHISAPLFPERLAVPV